MSTPEERRRTRDALAILLEVKPPMRTPYLKGLHGRDVVRKAVKLIDAQERRIAELEREVSAAWDVYYANHG